MTEITILMHAYFFCTRYSVILSFVDMCIIKNPYNVFFFFFLLNTFTFILQYHPFCKCILVCSHTCAEHKINSLPNTNFAPNAYLTRTRTQRERQVLSELVLGETKDYLLCFSLPQQTMTCARFVLLGKVERSERALEADWLTCLRGREKLPLGGAI